MQIYRWLAERSFAVVLVVGFPKQRNSTFYGENAVADLLAEYSAIFISSCRVGDVVLENVIGA
jgi:hypothetical protein